jgi:hypothetical protein
MTHHGEVYGRAKPRLVPHGVRAVVAIALVLCGVGAIVYAAAFHVIPVQSGPAEPEAAQPATPAVEAAPPSEAAPARPAAVMESEPALVKEVSVGGVMLAGSGDIQRTYSGQPPSQCPT